MIEPNISTETIEQLGKEKGLVDICWFKVVCRDSSNKSCKEYDITIDGIDCLGKKLTLFFTLTEWEEIHNGDNQTQE